MASNAPIFRGREAGAAFVALNSTLGSASTPLPPVTKPREMAAGGVHDAAFRALEGHTGPPEETRVIDVGAGAGAFSRRLLTAGYKVRSCDLHPELFRAPDITCLPVSRSGELPYADETADAVVDLELFEHIGTQ